MPSSVWPGTIPTYNTHVNITEVVDADHPNKLQLDVTAIATSIGTFPGTSTAVSSSDTFNPASVAYDTLKDRLTNIEKGIVGDSHSQYVKVGGGSVILPTVDGTVNVVLKQKSLSTANLFEARKEDNTLVTYIDSNGVLRGIEGVFASASDMNNLKALHFMSN